jgi:DNA replication factor GINS
MQERKGMVLSAALNGKSKLLESIAKNHKTKSTVVRFLKDIDQMVGADMEKYGPFQAEDVATLPYDNAQALIAKKIAMKIRWKD